MAPIAVPSNVEIEGYGMPIYVNIRYPWTWNGVKPSPPVVPGDDPNNTVNSYRRDVHGCRRIGRAAVC